MPKARTTITAPDSAEHREKVIVHIEVMSIAMYEYNYTTELSVDGAVILSTSDYIPAGEIETYDMSFYMPNHNVNLEVVVYYWDWLIEQRWIYATSKTKIITLGVPVEPEFAGTIIRKELKYDGRGNIPV